MAHRYEGMVVVFGEEFNLRWLLPLAGGLIVNQQLTAAGLVDYRRQPEPMCTVCEPEPEPDKDSPAKKDD